MKATECLRACAFVWRQRWMPHVLFECCVEPLDVRGHLSSS